MTNKKRIAIINKAFHPVIGGIETVVRQHARCLAQAHEVDVVVAGSDDQVTLNYLGEGYTLRRFKSNLTIAKTPFSLSLWLWLLREKYDVLYIHHPYPYASLISLFSRSDVIYYYHSDIVKQKRLNKIFEPILHFSLKQSKNIITSSPYLKTYSKLLLKYSHKTQIVPFWLDLQSTPNVNTQDPRSIENSYFLYFGRLAAYKGLEEIVEAITRIDKKITFVIAGNGEKRYLLDRIREYSNVTIVDGNISENKKNELLRGSYCLLFPSTSENEAFGIVQLEALRQGIPIINTKLNSGVPWVARDKKEAITITPGSVDELVDAIGEVSVSPCLRNFMSRNAQARYLDFQKDKLEQQLIKLFNQ